MRRPAIVLVVALATFAGACATPGGLASRDAIWDVRAQRFVERDALLAALARPRFRLLGELHDNPAHHALRAALIEALARRGAAPAVVMEPFVRDHDEALRAAQAAGADAEGIATAGRLDRASWRWPLHKPIVEAALAAGLPIRAGDLPRARLRGDLAATLEREPREPWAERLRRAPWTHGQATALDDAIVEGHCGKLSSTMLPRIALAQRARDASLAQALVDHATASGALLVAGNGHVRRDIGAPAYLAPAEGAVVSVAFVEAGDDERGRAESAAAYAREHAGFDYLWFTTATAREDPCARMPAAR